jgi:glycine betaine catabolism B
VSEASTPSDDAGILVCIEARHETHDVRTFIFMAATGQPPSYAPGQFLTFEFEIDGETVNRCYTLASSPTRPGRVAITVKRTGGPVSTWLHATMTPGKRVSALGPMGAFVCPADQTGRFLFLSAGSGITPLMSMARAHFDLASPADIVFVHSARSPADLIFRRELEMMAAARPNFSFAPICETGAPGETWSGYHGRLDLARLTRIAPDFRDREGFLCGPTPYMAAARAMLADAGFDMARLHAESFDFAELAAESPAVAAEAIGAAQARFTVEFTKSRRTIEVGAEQFVLSAAKAQGLRLPSSCTQGLCGTCKSRLVSGTVLMSHQGGIRQREIDQGLILLCCSRPTSNLVIER